MAVDGSSSYHRGQARRPPATHIAHMCLAPLCLCHLPKALGACHMAIFQHIDRILLSEGALQNELEEEHHHRQQ